MSGMPPYVMQTGGRFALQLNVEGKREFSPFIENLCVIAQGSCELQALPHPAARLDWWRNGQLAALLASAESPFIYRLPLAADRRLHEPLNVPPELVKPVEQIVFFGGCCPRYGPQRDLAHGYAVGSRQPSDHWYGSIYDLTGHRGIPYAAGCGRLCVDCNRNGRCRKFTLAEKQLAAVCLRKCLMLDFTPVNHDGSWIERAPTAGFDPTKLRRTLFMIEGHHAAFAMYGEDVWTILPQRQWCVSPHAAVIKDGTNAERASLMLQQAGLHLTAVALKKLWAWSQLRAGEHYDPSWEDLIEDIVLPDADHRNSSYVCRCCQKPISSSKWHRQHLRGTQHRAKAMIMLCRPEWLAQEIAGFMVMPHEYSNSDYARCRCGARLLIDEQTWLVHMSRCTWFPPV